MPTLRTRLYRLDRAAFEDGMRVVIRRQAIANAKQIAVATAMYTADYDDVLPRSDGDFKEMVGPYLKSEEAFNNPATGRNGFTKTYAGPAEMGKIQTPSTTEFGCVTAPGGRAVLYVDGHVVWIDDPAPSK